MPTSHRIADLADEVIGAATATEALRKIRELRAEIDAFEREQVIQALADGVTFATIARDLGVSRQAAHRRFRSLAAGEAPLQSTDDARRVVRFARDEALAVGSPAPTGSHVVVAALRAGDAPAAEVLRRAGATLERLAPRSTRRRRARRCSAARRGVPTSCGGCSRPRPRSPAPGATVRSMSSICCSARSRSRAAKRGARSRRSASTARA
jgi:hypothetical protein